jgi:N-methylhydantoinase A
MIEPVPDPGEPALVGVDVGGTFTDAVLIHRGRLTTAKVPTTPADQSRGVMDAVAVVLRDGGLTPGEVTELSHGMTVGTNALLEGKGAATALVATAGFGDVLELRRQDRAHLYDLTAHHMPPLVPAERVVEATERVGPDGVVSPLTREAVDDVTSAVARTGAEAVAVGLLFSYAHPEHERTIAAAIRAALPDVHVSTSSEVLPEIREYERISTTVVDAYLNPVLARYLERLEAETAGAGLPAPGIMLSNGGVLPVADAAGHAAWTVLSGPAAGVIGAAGVAALAGMDRVLTFDMGGTSCDVALVEHGAPARAAGTTIAGHPISLPMLDVATVSAGGGSIAWADSGGALRVGPHSAGAHPGPAAYGRGGDLPTVTDANLVLGRLDPDLTLGDHVRLDREAAERAVDRLARSLRLSRERCAEGIVAVAVHEMVRALRLVSVERGVDPRETALIAFGGAGPLHACQVADELGIRRVVAPAAAGVLAALGLVVAGERRDRVQTVLLDAADAAGLRARLAPLRERALGELPGGRLHVEVDCRYAGQSFALTVPWDPGGPSETLPAAFHAAHRERYGDADPEGAVEAVSLRVAVDRPGTEVTIAAGGEDDLGEGPAVVAMAGATCWLAEGWRAHRDGHGMIVAERG